MLDFLGFIVTAALMVLAVNAIITFMDVTQSAKLTLAGLAGLWIGIAAAAASVGMVAISKPFPVIGSFVAAPLVMAAIATAWPRARRAMLSIPVPLMIGLNAGRVFAVLFLLLAAEGRLAGPFPYFAGWGDIITGMFAIPVAWLAKDARTRHLNAIAAWDLFGAADLVLAITLGVTSAERSPLQIFMAAPGSAAMQQLPWSFVPTVLVPFWLILHAIIWVQVRRLRSLAAGENLPRRRSPRAGLCFREAMLEFDSDLPCWVLFPLLLLSAAQPTPPESLASFSDMKLPARVTTSQNGRILEGDAMTKSERFRAIHTADTRGPKRPATPKSKKERPASKGRVHKGRTRN